MKIEPAGMTYARALQIAVESLGRTGGTLHHVSSDNSNRFRLTDAQRAQIVSLGGSLSLADVALEVGVTDRTVSRVLAEHRAQERWSAELRRRQNLESFRHMTEEWRELA